MVPMFVTAVTITMEINAAIKPYSIAVAADLDRIKARIFFVKSGLHIRVTGP